MLDNKKSDQNGSSEDIVKGIGGMLLQYIAQGAIGIIIANMLFRSFFRIGMQNIELTLNQTC